MQIDGSSGQVIYKDGTPLPDFIIAQSVSQIDSRYQGVTFDKTSKTYTLTVQDGQQTKQIPLNQSDMSDLLDESTNVVVNTALQKRGLRLDPDSGNIFAADGTPVDPHTLTGLDADIEKAFAESVVNPAVAKQKATTEQQSKAYDDKMKSLDDSNYNNVQVPRSAGVTMLELGALGGVVGVGAFLTHKWYKNRNQLHEKEVRAVEKEQARLEKSFNPGLMTQAKLMLPEALHQRLGVEKITEANRTAAETRNAHLKEQLRHLQTLQGEARATAKEISNATGIKASIERRIGSKTLADTKELQTKLEATHKAITGYKKAASEIDKTKPLDKARYNNLHAQYVAPHLKPAETHTKV
jgi:hypothetical protein